MSDDIERLKAERDTYKAALAYALGGSVGGTMEEQLSEAYARLARYDEAWLSHVKEDQERRREADRRAQEAWDRENELLAKIRKLEGELDSLGSGG